MDTALPIRPGEHACCRLAHTPDRERLARAFVRGRLRLDLDDVALIDVAGMRALRGRTGQSSTIVAASAAVRRLPALLAWDTDPAIEVLAPA
jgi:hypothetical protein